MIQCQKCGQTNDATSNFCRFCGANFSSPAVPQMNPSPQQSYEQAPPRPYSWKTEEFSNDPTRMLGSSPAPAKPSRLATQPDINLQPYAPQQVATGYHCPQCHSRLLPRIERRISMAGWIVFGVLMITFFPLFWIGLLIRENVSVCPVCNHRFQTNLG